MNMLVEQLISRQAIGAPLCELPLAVRQHQSRASTVCRCTSDELVQVAVAPEPQGVKIASSLVVCSRLHNVTARKGALSLAEAQFGKCVIQCRSLPELDLRFVDSASLLGGATLMIEVLPFGFVRVGQAQPMRGGKGR